MKPQARRYESLRARLDANSVEYRLRDDLEKPCRIWQGAKNSQGYGIMNTRVRVRATYTVKGEQKKVSKVKRRLAHRMSLADVLGVPVWRLKTVSHFCDNKPCIEPTHLRNTTQRGNMQECVSRGRHNSQNGSLKRDPRNCGICAEGLAGLNGDKKENNARARNDVARSRAGSLQPENPHL